MTSMTNTLMFDREDLSTGDILTIASKLRTMLLYHDRSLKQITLIENYMTRLTQQALIYVQQGRKGQALRILTRKAVALGIKYLYRLYRLRKWHQVQQFVRTITYTLQSEAPPILSLADYSSLADSDTDQTRIISQTLTVVHCNYYRYD
ncbi:uncharacterized protein LOC132553158 [Ylistrum balloti]|uniref:uncharacterized protein LOC132553158 n=1 Tax=Ylistrum balloti TaxID=509963 RepID=UPI002905945A|nr:uncharacterized protein LOC132553158 [Ylistrum balloti]